MGELFRIINGALRLDLDKVRNYTAFLAEKLELSGDVTSAQRLRKLLEENDHQLRPAGVNFAKALPVDSESRFPLLERVNLRGANEPPIVLPQEQWDTVHEFLSVAKSHSQVESSSISLLLYGPPGTGKSRLARHLALELGLELLVARLDGLISSFLGSTSKNIRALFEYASKTPCILFLDEFDAIAKLRGDSQELGELKRVVNSFIQNLDALGAQSVVVAATNHEELLDPAVWRRFSYRIALGFPSPSERRIMWDQFVGKIKFSEKQKELLVDLSEGFSGSDIREVCLRLNRRQVSSGKEPHLKEVFSVLKNLAIGEGESRRFVASFHGKDEATITALLRQRNKRLYSHSSVALLFGISKATAYRRLKEGHLDA